MNFKNQNLKILSSETTRPFCHLKPQGLEPWYLVCSIYFWTLTQYVQNMALQPKMAFPQGLHVLHRLIWGKHKKSSCLKLQGLEPWYLVCSIYLWTLTQYVQNMALQPKMAFPRGLHALHRLIWGKHKKSSYLKPQGLEPWYLVCSIYQWTLNLTSDVQNMALQPKMAFPWGSHVLHMLI